MANEEHLKILEQGVKAWNKWRKQNPNIKPDLSRATLGDKILHDINLSETDLRKAHLMEVSLTKADLSRANLTKANLHRAGFIATKLEGANLSEAECWEANFWNADLEGAKMIGANFQEANFRDAYLGGADLSGADIRNAEFFEANLEKANLKNSDLSFSILIGSDLTGAVLTGAKLFGTVRDYWLIKDVQCEYVYWDIWGEQRSPKDRDLEPGEFERLYAVLPTIEYVFESGMSPIDTLIMDRVVQAIREKRPEFDIKIDSINARGLAPSIKFTVQHEEHKETALEEVRKGYDDRISRLEDEKDRLYNLLGQAIDKAGDVRLITGSIIAMDNATINIEQHIHNALELQKAIADEPEESKGFAKVAKKTALDIIGGAIKDIAKGQVKEAAKEIIELGKDLGPIIAKTAAYAFFSSM